MRALGWLVIFLVGCGPRVSVDAESAEGSGDEGGGPDDDAGPTADADDGGDDGPIVTDVPGPGVCPPTAEFMCPNGIGDCGPQPCGDMLSPFDENGCLRPQCPCPEGSTCFAPADFGGCASGSILCYDDGAGACVCEADDDCSGTYCIPGDVSPYPCLWAENEGDCLEANCRWWPGSRVVDGELGCACDEVQGVCVPPVDIEPEFASYSFNSSPAEAIRLPIRLSPTPLGLTLCEDQPSQACECAEASDCF